MEKKLMPSMLSFLEEIKGKLVDEPLIYKMFERCYVNTLDTTVSTMEDGTTYVITGDIPAMWLRDSTCQLRPYYFLAQRDEGVAQLMEGLVKRQMMYILHDPYANAFNKEENGACCHQDETAMSGWIWERKYEIDSLCFPIQLAYLLWKNTGRTSQFDAQFVKAIQYIIDIWKIEQKHEEASAYRFIRRQGSYTDTLSREGRGALVKSGIGLTWSGFRPSDDACTYGYLIPSNMFAAVVLRYIEEIATVILDNQDLAWEAKALSKEIERAIEAYGVVEHPEFGKVYAYEVDGFGQYNLMDDANIPSLLAIPYIGYHSAENPIYQNTRRMILSEANPYFYKGEFLQGIGSPHTPINHVWPIALGVEGMTSDRRSEKKRLLDMMVKTDGNKQCMHEGVYVDNPNRYTREWFSWANAIFCELVMDFCGYRLIVK